MTAHLATGSSSGATNYKAQRVVRRLFRGTLQMLRSQIDLCVISQVYTHDRRLRVCSEGRCPYEESCKQRREIVLTARAPKRGAAGSYFPGAVTPRCPPFKICTDAQILVAQSVSSSAMHFALARECAMRDEVQLAQTATLASRV